jgi:hypothetical protein
MIDIIADEISQDFARKYQICDGDQVDQHPQAYLNLSPNNEPPTSSGNDVLAASRDATRSNSVATQSTRSHGIQKPARITNKAMFRDAVGPEHERILSLDKEEMTPGYRGLIRSLHHACQVEAIMTQLCSAPQDRVDRTQPDPSLPNPDLPDEMKVFVEQIHDAIMDWSSDANLQGITFAQQQKKILGHNHTLSNISVECIS